jgi:hypothetical protein
MTGYLGGCDVGTSNRSGRGGVLSGRGLFLIVFALERKSECKKGGNEHKGL